MPDSLPPEIRRRLGLVLALLTSDKDGEVLNAARMAVKMLHQHGMRPEDLLTLVAPRAEEPRYQPPPPPRDDEETIRDAAGYAEWLLDEAAGITDRERAFLNDLVEKQWRRATEKQTSWLRSIARKVPARAKGYGT